MSPDAESQHDYSSVPVDRLTMALHELHRALDPGDSVNVLLPQVPGLDLCLEGAGFATGELLNGELLNGEHGQVPARLTRLRTLADAIGPNLAVLAVGLNPSLTAADCGFGFASPSNRFWKAAVASGLITVPRNPALSVQTDRVGFTDLVKRATPKAADLKVAEFAEGRRRLEWTINTHRPAVVCVMGVTGWRKAYDPDATLGLQPNPLGGRPVYVMPNSSGLNAHTNHDDLVAHFKQVLGIAE